MKIHTTTIQCEEVEKILYDNNILFKKIIDRKLSKYKNYYNYNLPEYTYNDEYVKNHIYYEIKNWKPEYFQLFNTPQSKKKYIHYGNFDDFRRVLLSGKVIINVETKQPNYPIYIISYQRFEKLYTIKYLEEMNINYYICIKEKEKNNYLISLQKQNYKNYNFLIMDEKYELEQNNNGNHGSIPQRNKCWEHSVKNGFKSHWILDDNINGFYIYNKQKKYEYNHSSFFSLLEEFRDNIIEPIGLLSPNYTWDFPSIDHRIPFNINRKNYSCILINTELLDKYDIKWRKTFNEDVRLTLDCLLHEIRTIGFNQFLIDKKPTGSVKGGNTEIYKQHTIEGFKDKFNEIKNEYPEFIESIKKHKDERLHHNIKTSKFNYFKNVSFKINFTEEKKCNNNIKFI
jgi:hypothetical protein